MPDSSDWQVIRKAGTEIRVPRKSKLSRTVGGQIPTGFDPTVWGISPDMASSIDRLAVWNIVATVDAFLSAGFSPAEVMRYVHPSHGGQHPGHRHGRQHLDAGHVSRKPAGP